jgi:polyhydroxybutyrate depolymerase
MHATPDPCRHAREHCSPLRVIDNRCFLWFHTVAVIELKPLIVGQRSCLRCLARAVGAAAIVLALVACNPGTTGPAPATDPTAVASLTAAATPTAVARPIAAGRPTAASPTGDPSPAGTLSPTGGTSQAGTLSPTGGTSQAGTLSPIAAASAGAAASPTAPTAPAGLTGLTGAEDHSTRSAGCAKPAKAGAFTLSTLDGNRKSRTYLMAVPADYSASQSYALVFVFHGGGGNGTQSAAWGLQRAAGAAGSAIFVFPNGITFQREGIGWDDRKDGYDLPFFDNMLNDLEAAYCIDPQRIFVAGFSWGADFAILLACQRGDELRAVAANSTSDEFKDTSNYLTYQGLPCGARKHPPIRFVHAFEGDSQYPPPDFATTSKLFQFLNSCGTTSTKVQSSSAPLSCVSFNGCASEYVECTFERSLGHVIPPNWAEDTWNFFSAHAR